MEQPSPPAPPLSSSSAAVAAAVAAAPPHLNYPDSVDSSPRSRNTDSWDDQFMSVPGGAKLRLMCSYGGHIVPRPHDKSLCYISGDTRIVVVDRHTTLSDLTNRLSKTLLNGRPFSLKYQLPNEDLDSLISVTTDEDLENMIEEYDRLTTNAAQKSSRLRLFLFPSKPDSASSIESLLDNSTKSEDWFLNALNGSTRGFSESASVNCLLGLEDDVAIAGNANSSEKDVEAQIESFGNVKGVIGNTIKQDVHSVPDSPMLETTSSFGSTSSSPSLANLPPIRVHVEDQKAVVAGIDEQFSHMSVGAAVQKQDDGGFVVSSSPSTVLTTFAAATAAVSGVPMGSAVVAGEFSNRVFSDDERSEQGMPLGYRRPLQAQGQGLAQPLPPQSQPKPTGGLDFPSPDSVSSDGSITNPLSRQRPMIYQDPIVQIPSGNNRVPVNPVEPKMSDPNSVQMQQVQDSGYILPTQFDQHHQQLNPPQQQQQFIQSTQFDQQHQQLNQQQQQQQQQFIQSTQFDQQLQQLNQQHQQFIQSTQFDQHHQQLNPQQQQQQFIQAGAQFIQHHSPGAMPISSYYPIYPSQQQQHHHPHHALDQQYPVYYVPARQPQAYNLSMQQPNYSEASAPVPSSRPQTPPPPTMIPTSAAYNPARNAPSPKPEMGAGMYRTATAATPPLVQAPSSQHQPQYVGFSQIHHPSQSIAPTSAATANYAYEFADPTHAQIYYTRPLAPQLAAQYQTMTSASAMVLPEASAQHPTDNIKQQIRTSQPL